MNFIILEKAKAYSRVRHGKLEQVKATQGVASQVVHSEVLKLIKQYTDLIRQKKAGKDVDSKIGKVMKRLDRIRAGGSLQPPKYTGSARGGYYKIENI